jgi:Fe-S oxidoreductase
MNCGLCNTVDPILAAVRKESASSRYKIVLAKQGATSPLFYLATDPSLQETICPAGVNFTQAFREARERNVAAGVTTQANEKMRQNFLKNGTPYDSMESDDFFDKPVW